MTLSTLYLQQACSPLKMARTSPKKGEGENDSNSGEIISSPAHQQAPVITNNDGTTPIDNSWLFSASGKTQDLQQQHKRRRFFEIDIPAIPEPVHHAIAKKIKQEQSVRFTQQEHKIRQLKAKLADQRSKAEGARSFLQELEQSKEDGLKDIEKLRKEEIEKTIAQKQKALRDSHEQEIQKMETEYMEKLEKECHAEADRKSQERMKKIQEEEEAAAAAAKAEQEKPNADDAEAPLSKLPKVVASSSEEAEEGEEIEDEAKQQPTLYKSEILKKEVEELKATVEKANENRTELIWLLKQIIKAEEKQRAGMANKPNAQISASKQA